MRLLLKRKKNLMSPSLKINRKKMNYLKKKKIRKIKTKNKMMMMMMKI
jgi:hypothetical protein